MPAVTSYYGMALYSSCCWLEETKSIVVVSYIGEYPSLSEDVRQTHDLSQLVFHDQQALIESVHR